MALLASGLETVLYREFISEELESKIDAETLAHIRDRISKLAKVLVTYIKANAIVSTTVTGTCPVGGGPLTLGQGTGTIS